MTNPLLQLRHFGQSVWYDFITRQLMTSGTLAQLIREDGLSGLTSNPTIFEKAISGSRDYDEDIRRLAADGHGARDIFERLTVLDVQAACDAFRDVYDRTEGRDGLVSIEVAPDLAYRTEATAKAAERLWGMIDRPNLMIKIPGTAPGLPAIERCLAAGININITLLFSVDRYRAVIEAYLRGLEHRLADGHEINRVASVASFFVSRVDSKVDPLLEAAGAPDAVRSRAAIANASAAYAAFQEVFRGPRWEALAKAGARVQRPLWASTSTKDDRLPDVYYVEALIASDTVNTLPPTTFDAYRDHGRPAPRLAQNVSRAEADLEALTPFAIDLTQVTAELEDEGVEKFAASFEQAVATIEHKASVLAGTR